jgi:hypothetical protein
MPRPGDFKRLPDHVVAPLLHALMAIPRRPDTPLTTHATAFRSEP